MKFDDPALLSAYVDDELSAEERSLVDRAVLGSARLARQVEDLRALKAGLAGLPVPVAERSSVDDVTRRLARQTRQYNQTRVAMLWMSVGVIAACFVIAWSMHLLQMRQSYVGGGAVFQMPTVAQAPAADMAPAEAEGNSVAVDAAPAVNVAETARAAAEAPDQAGLNLRDDLARRLRALLGQADAARLTVRLEGAGLEALKALDAALHRVPRSERFHARVSIEDGLALDPASRGETTVFAVALDDTEYANLRSAIAGIAGATIVDESPAAASLVALLAESSNVAFGEVEPSGSVSHDRAHERQGFADRADGIRAGGRRERLEPTPDGVREARGPLVAWSTRSVGGRPNGVVERAAERVAPEVVPQALADVLTRLDRVDSLLRAPATKPPDVKVRLIWVSVGGA